MPADRADSSLRDDRYPRTTLGALRRLADMAERYQTGRGYLDSFRLKCAIANARRYEEVAGAVSHETWESPGEASGPCFSSYVAVPLCGVPTTRRTTVSTVTATPFRPGRDGERAAAGGSTGIADGL